MEYKINKSGTIINKHDRVMKPKLTAEEVLEIRAKYIPRVYTAPMLAIEYGVTEGHIMKIISRRICS